MVVFLFGINLVRCELTTRGNKTNQMVPLFWSYVLIVPVVAGLCFFLKLQSYVYVSFYYYHMFQLLQLKKSLFSFRKATN